MKRFGLIFFSLAFIFSAGNAQASFQMFQAPPQIKTDNGPTGIQSWQDFFDLLSGKPKPAADQLFVTVKNAETGEPLAGATVLVGAQEGNPFPGNKVLTNEKGVATFQNGFFKSGQAFTLTASKDGFANVSKIDTVANTAELSLLPQLKGDEFSFLEGKVYGWPSGYNKKTLEVGFFLPGIRPESLLNFDPQQIVSSYKVEMDVYGKRMVPGNVVMPYQEKRYMIFPITLNKPEFTMPLPRGLTAHMSAAIGAVPIGDAIDAIRSKDFLGVLNLATITHVNWTDRMTVNGNQRFDITASQALQKGMLSARYAGIPDGLDVVAISAADPTGDRGDLVAVDVKSLKSEDVHGGTGSISLAGLPGAQSSYIFSAVFDRRQFAVKRPTDITRRALTGRLQKVSGTSVELSKVLQVIQPENVSADHRDYRFTSPNTAGVNADFLILTVYAEVPNPLTQGKIRKVLWSAVLPGNATSVKLPDLGKPVLPAPGEDWAFFWEVVAVKSNSAAQWNSGFDLSSSLSGLEYVSSMAQKF